MKEPVLKYCVKTDNLNRRNIMQKLTTLDLENIDQVDFDDFFSAIQSQLAGEESNIPIPGSKIEARKWVMAYLKAESEIEYLAKEYKAYIKNRYIDPIDDRVDRLERSQDFIKEGLLKFLENAELDSVPFPDFATISKAAGKEKIVYPENEEELAENLHKTGKDSFVRTKHSLDKKAIAKYYSENSDLPFSGLSVEEGVDSVRVTRSKAYKASKGLSE